jgi:hypothetical protein
MIDKGGIMSEVASGAIVQTAGWRQSCREPHPLVPACAELRP